MTWKAQWQVSGRKLRDTDGVEESELEVERGYELILKAHPL